jgi:CHAT domain-containing protein
MSGCETGIGVVASCDRSQPWTVPWHRVVLYSSAWVMFGAVIILPQPSCQAADEGNSINRKPTTSEAVYSGISDEDFTFTFCWDRWKEDKSVTKRTDQGYKALADPSNRGFKRIEDQSLMLLYGAFSEIDRYASSAPPEVFTRFAQQYRDAFLALSKMQFPSPVPVTEMFSSGIRKLAAAYRLRGDDKAATEFYTAEIERCRKASANAQLARTLDGLGILLAAQGKTKEAEQLFRESLALRLKLNSADEVRSWMLLAGLQAIGNSPSAAESALAQAMARLGAGQVNFTVKLVNVETNELYMRQVNALAPMNELAWQFQANGQYASAHRLMSLALSTAEKWLAVDDVRMVRQRKLAACCAYAAGDRAMALKLLQQANDSSLRYLRSTAWPLGYESTTDCVVHLQGDGSFTASFGSTEELAQELIEQKGYAFRQQLQKRRLLALPAASPAAKVLWQELVTQRTAYRDQLLAGHMGNYAAGAGSAVDNAEKERNTLEAKLAAAIGAPALDAGTSLIRLTEALPKGSAYVDYALCDRWIDKVSFTEEWCAMVVQSGGPPAVARCGPLQTVSVQISAYLGVAQKGDASDSVLASASQALYSSLIAPVEKLLTPEAKIVFICPDGPLSSIGLGALLDESGHFWCEKRDVRYVTDGWAILKAAAEVSLKPDQLIGLLGNPVYDAAPGNTKGSSGFVEVDPLAGLSPELIKQAEALSPDFRKQVQDNMDKILKRAPKTEEQEHLEPLPGSGDEVKALQTFFGHAGLNVVALLGSDATEPRLRSLPPCTILHLATHGDFVKEIPSRYQLPGPAVYYKAVTTDITGMRSGAQTSEVGPTMRSFLALAGAQTTLNQWNQANFPKTVDDGLLMADEVMDMDFSRTLLVTLSGCETGVGKSVRGEGTVGIQRAFLIAGARHVLATLWPIQDIETVDFMKAFYARVVQGGETPPGALSAVQRELLVQRRAKKGLAYAVYLTAPFIITSASQ